MWRVHEERPRPEVDREWGEQMEQLQRMSGRVHRDVAVSDRVLAPVREVTEVASGLDAATCELVAGRHVRGATRPDAYLTAEGDGVRRQARLYRGPGPRGQFRTLKEYEAWWAALPMAGPVRP